MAGGVNTDLPNSFVFLSLKLKELSAKSLQCLKTVELVINRHYLIRKQINEVPHAELCSDDMEGLLEAGGIRS